MRFIANFAACSGLLPFRRFSTAIKEGKKRIITSPSPVAAAAPILFIAYAPEPGIGESPTLLVQLTIRFFQKIVIQKTLEIFNIYPGILCLAPFVEVPAAIFPVISIAIIPIVS